MDFKVKDEGLAEQGKKDIDWAEAHMPVLNLLKKRFQSERPFEGLKIACCLHVTKETGVLMRTMMAGGAEMYLCGSNPLSTNDGVAAELVKEGVHVFAWRGQGNEDFFWSLDQVLEVKPEITVDDGSDLTVQAHKNNAYPWAGSEETTTGVVRLRAMEADGALKFPVIAVNDAKTKMMFDNRYGTGQSTIDGILRGSAILIAGKTFVVVGYGWCSRGIAKRARGMGAHVIVTEVDPVKALEAHMDGFRVMKMADAVKEGDVFVSATGNKHTITTEHFKAMKDGALLANSGHFDVEVDVKGLREMAKSTSKARPCVEEFVLEDGKKLYLLGEGRLVNLACAEGHPSEVMQMSFANQALCAEHIAKNKKNLEARMLSVPPEIDEAVARLALEANGIRIDSLTKEQKDYLSSWEEGT